MQAYGLPKKLKYFFLKLYINTNNSMSLSSFIFNMVITNITICIIIATYTLNLTVVYSVMKALCSSFDVNIVFSTFIIYVLTMMFLLAILLFGNNSSLINIMFVAKLITLWVVAIMFIYFLIGLWFMNVDKFQYSE